MTSPRIPSRLGPIVGVLVLVAVLAAGAGTWYLFFRTTGPPPVSLASLPVATAPGGTAAADAGVSPGASTGNDPGPSGSPATLDGIAGSWTADTSIGSFSDFSSTFAGYRVREELASVGAAEAVGRTPDVAGSLTIEGTTITAGQITVDLTTLQSDERMRDGQLRRQALETSRFPKATFVLNQPVDLGSPPAEGATVEVTLTGDLTLHGVTKTIQVPMQARLQDGVITVVGSLPIVFADYGISPPQSMMVLSVEDQGTMEFQVHFTRS